VYLALLALKDNKGDEQSIFEAVKPGSMTKSQVHSALCNLTKKGVISRRPVRVERLVAGYQIDNVDLCEVP